MIRRILKQIGLSRKLTLDVIWNAGSFGMMGVAGIMINIIIAKSYDAATLGVFNQVYGIYILLSQVAVGGVHFSVLKHTSQFSDDEPRMCSILSAGVFLVVALAAFVTTITYLTRDVFANILDSDDVAIGILYALPGLFFSR